MKSQSRQDFVNPRIGAEHRLYRKVNNDLLASGVHFRYSPCYAVTISASYLIRTAVRSSSRVLTKASRLSSPLSSYFRRRRGQKLFRSEVIHKLGHTTHGTTTIRHTGHVTTRYMIYQPSVCFQVTQEDPISSLMMAGYCRNM
jgi:hypothetical protein